MKIARRFSAGIKSKREIEPAKRATEDHEYVCRPLGGLVNLRNRFPSAEALGYCQAVRCAD